MQLGKEDKKRKKVHKAQNSNIKINTAKHAWYKQRYIRCLMCVLCVQQWAGLTPAQARQNALCKNAYVLGGNVLGKGTIYLSTETHRVWVLRKHTNGVGRLCTQCLAFHVYFIYQGRLHELLTPNAPQSSSGARQFACGRNFRVLWVFGHHEQSQSWLPHPCDRTDHYDRYDEGKILGSRANRSW